MSLQNIKGYKNQQDNRNAYPTFYGIAGLMPWLRFTKGAENLQRRFSNEIRTILQLTAGYENQQDNRNGCPAFKGLASKKPWILQLTNKSKKTISAHSMFKKSHVYDHCLTLPLFSQFLAQFKSNAGHNRHLQILKIFPERAEEIKMQSTLKESISDRGKFFMTYGIPIKERVKFVHPYLGFPIYAPSGIKMIREELPAISDAKKVHNRMIQIPGFLFNLIKNNSRNTFKEIKNNTTSFLKYFITNKRVNALFRFEIENSYLEGNLRDCHEHKQNYLIDIALKSLRSSRDYLKLDSYLNLWGNHHNHTDVNAQLFWVERFYVQENAFSSAMMSENIYINQPYYMQSESNIGIKEKKAGQVINNTFNVTVNAALSEATDLAEDLGGKLAEILMDEARMYGIKI